MSVSANSILNAYFKKVTEVLKKRDEYLKSDPFKKKKDSVKEIIAEKLKEAIERSNDNTDILDDEAQEDIKKIAETRNNLIEHIDSSFDNYYQYKNNDTASRIAELTAKKDDYIKRVNNLKNGVLGGTYSKENVEAGENIKELSDTSSELKNERDNKEKEKKALEASLKSTKKDLSYQESILSTLEDLEASEQAYSDELSSLKENPTENEEAIKKIEAELARINDLKKLYSSKEDILEKINSLNSQIKDLENRINDCNSIWTNRQQDIVRINEEIQTKEKKVYELNEEITRFENEINSCKENMEDIKDNYKNDLQKAKDCLTKYCELVNSFGEKNNRQELANCLNWVGSAPDIEKPRDGNIVPLKKIFEGIPGAKCLNGSIELSLSNFDSNPPLKDINIKETSGDVQITFTKDGEKNFNDEKNNLNLNELFYVFSSLKETAIEEKEEKLREEVLNSRVRFKEIKAKLEIIKEAYDNVADSAEEEVNKLLETDDSVSGKAEAGKDFTSTVAQVITNNLSEQLVKANDPKKDETLEEFKKFVKDFLDDLKNGSILNGVREEDFPKINHSSVNGAEEFLSDDNKFVFTTSPYKLSAPKNLYKYLKDDQGLIYSDDVETVISDMLNREGFLDNDVFGGLRCPNFYNGLLSGDDDITEKGAIGINSDTEKSCLYKYLAKSCDEETIIEEFIKEFEKLL